MPDWTAPRTWEPDEDVTAAQFNAHIRDNSKYLYSAPACKAVQPSTGSLASDTWQAAVWSDVEYDTASLAGLSGHISPPSQTLTIRKTGIYVITALVRILGGGLGAPTRACRIVRSGTDVMGQATVHAVPANAETWLTASAQGRIAAGTALQVQGFQNAGGAVQWDPKYVALRWIGDSAAT